MTEVPRFCQYVQPVVWSKRNPIGEWLVWMVLVTKAPSLGTVGRLP